jgi:cytochrome b561
MKPRITEPAAAQQPRFDGVSIAVHWLTLVLVVGTFGAATAIGQLQDEASADALLTWHRSLGVAIWTLSAARLVWRMTRARIPPLPRSMSAPLRLAAHVNAWALYLLMLVQPLTGVAQTVYRGHPFELFLWRIPALVGRDKAMVHLWHAVHEWGAWLFAALVGLHAGAALFHTLVLRDGVLARMWPRSGPIAIREPRSQR